MKTENFVVATFVVFMAAWIWLPTSGYGSDVGAFQAWTVFVYEHGLRHAYEFPDMNYNPLFIEWLWVFGRIQGPVARINSTFFVFKLFVLIFDFAGVYLAAYLLKRHRRNIALSLLILFNIAYVYNTFLWGQVDAIYTFFIALSIFLANRRYVTLSLLAALIAINFKTIAAAFAPLIVLLNLPEIMRDRRPLLRAVVAGLVVQVLILLPFFSPREMKGIKLAFQSLMDATSSLSPSGMNLWSIAYGTDAFLKPAETKLFHVRHSIWGLALFFVAAGVILWPLFRITVLEKKKLDDGYVFIASALYGLAFFFFKTGMHERYSHPIILLSGIAAVLSGRYVLYVVASIGYFLNLERCFGYFALHSYSLLIFDYKFVAVLFLFVLVAGAIQMHRDANASTLAAG